MVEGEAVRLRIHTQPLIPTMEVDFMIETNSSVAQAPAPSQAQRQALAIQQARTVGTLVLRAAINAVKHELRGRGLKPQHYSPAQLRVMADRLLADPARRPKLIAQARALVDRLTAEGFFKPRRTARRVQPEASEILSGTRAKRGDKSTIDPSTCRASNNN
jgi:hypothetical protein